MDVTGILDILRKEGKEILVCLFRQRRSSESRGWQPAGTGSIYLIVR